MEIMPIKPVVQTPPGRIRCGYYNRVSRHSNHFKIKNPAGKNPTAGAITGFPGTAIIYAIITRPDDNAMVFSVFSKKVQKKLNFFKKA